MIDQIKRSLWSQFGASMDMLENVLQLCPDTYFESDRKFFHLAFHSIIFLDYYLTIPPKDFSPVLSFTIKDPNELPDEAIGDVFPDRLYSKKELIAYLSFCRQKCRQLISSLTEEQLGQRFVEEGEKDAMDFSLMEILLYNMRHVQHHVAQLNWMLRNEIDEATAWVFRASED